MKKVIITGSPGSGKSTLLKELSSHFTVTPEVSREIITKQQALKTDISPWGDVETFAKLSLLQMISQYDQQKDHYCIYDRAIPDVIALLRFRQKHVSASYLQNVKKHLTGNMVFFAPPWETIYTSDDQRPESFAETLPMSKLLREVYHELGFKLVELPKEPTASRVEFIKQTLTSAGIQENHFLDC